jgi:hypothetical protein
MRIAVLVCVALASVAFTACADKNNNPYASNAKPAPAGPPPKIEGVDPDHFDCKAFLSEAEVAQAALGEVKWTPADMPASPGTPLPCVYVSAVQPPDPPDAAPHRGPDAGPVPSKGIQAWQFHLDCRPVAIGDARAIIEQMKPQEGSKDVALGRGAIDHSSARIVAIDDDTDCAAYVVGPDETSRAALARLVLAKLTRSNMPRSPHAVN